MFAHNFEKTFYGAAGKYEGDAWKVWAKVCPVNRLVQTDDKNVFVSEHCFDGGQGSGRPAGGRCGVVVVNNGGRVYSGMPRLWKDWRVTHAITDDSDLAKWEGGRLSLAPCAGILLMAEKVAR